MARRIRNRGRLPGFFKVVMEPGNHHLSLPPAFVRKYDGNIPRRFVLVDKYGRSWEVSRGRCEDGRECFGKGWKDLAHAWDIQFQDFITFKPVTQATIKFKVFSRDSCEKSLRQAVDSRISSLSSSESEPQEHHCAMTQLRTDNHRGKDPMVKREVDSESDSERTDIGRVDKRNLEQSRRRHGKQIGRGMARTKHQATHHKMTPIRMNQGAGEQLGMGKPDLGSFSVRATKRHVSNLAMNIPKAIARKLPDKTTPLKLRLPGGISCWDCMYTVDKGSPRINMHGWRVVVKESQIKAGDILKFELVNSGPKCIEFMFYHTTTNPPTI